MSTGSTLNVGRSFTSIMHMQGTLVLIPVVIRSQSTAMSRLSEMADIPVLLPILIFLLSPTTHVEFWLSQQFFFHSKRSWASSDHLVIFIFLKSFFTSSSHLFLGLRTGRVASCCHLCIFFTILVSGFLCI